MVQVIVCLKLLVWLKQELFFFAAVLILGEARSHVNSEL